MAGSPPAENPAGVRRRGEIRIVKLHKSYSTSHGSVVAVGGIDLTVSAGTFFTILGSSGSGKTTLLMMIAGLVQPTSGDIYIDGQLATNVPAYRRDLSVVFQNYALFPHMSVGQNVGFPLEMRRVGRAEIRERVGWALNLVGLPGYERRYPRQLSGGQQQRVALARAIVFEPRVLLMDEPLGALDRRLRERMQFEVKQLQRKLGVTVVYVTHDQSEALSMSDQVAIMSAGLVVQSGSGRDLYQRPVNDLVAQFLGETNILRGRVVGVGEDGLARIDHGGDFVSTAQAESWLSVGLDVAVSLRPEHLDISSDLGQPPAPGETSSNSLCGRIVDAVYLGEYVKYRVALRDGELFTVNVHNRPGVAELAQGEQVRVAWTPSHAVVLR